MAIQLVIDSSVIIKWFVAEVDSATALTIYSRYLIGDIELLAPDLINSEVGNVIWQKQMNQGMAPADAQQVLADSRDTGIDLTSTADLLMDAYQIAVTYRCSVYDAMYVALSTRENCQVVTADTKLVRAVGTAFPNVVMLANWS